MLLLYYEARTEIKTIAKTNSISRRLTLPARTAVFCQCNQFAWRHNSNYTHARNKITLFHVTGSLLYCDPEGKVVGAEDVFTKLELAKKHYAEVGLGEDFVQQFVR